MNVAFLLLLAMVAGSLIPAVRALTESSAVACLLYYGVSGGMLYASVPRVSVQRREALRRSMRLYALSGAAVFLALRFLTGVCLKCLSATPYDTSLPGICKNMLWLFAPLLAKEWVRSYGLGLSMRHIRGRALAAVLLSLFLALTELNFSRVLRLGSAEDRFIFAASTVLPTLADSAVRSALVLFGGMGASVLYAGAIGVFQHVFPFLPDLPWLASSAIGLCFPIFFLLYLREQFRGEEYGARTERQRVSFAWYAELLCAVAFYWFCIGVFPVYPTVILTGSMEPGIHPGDVILVRKLSSEEELDTLSAGTVISYHRDKISITHRIQEIREDEAGNRQFITKGDNNASADAAPVSPNQIAGRVIRVVPRIGIPVLLFLNALRRQSSLEEKTLYSYTVGATGTPRVHLLENSVYPGEWLENGEVYPASLTDYIEFQLSAKLAGSGDARAVSSGTYTIGVELSGYYSTEGGKKTIFTRQFPLEEGEIPAGEDGAAEIQKTVQVRPADYSENLTEIEKELGGSFERSCKLVFSGTFSLQCADKTAEQPFSLAFSLPVDSKNTFYQLNPDADCSEQGSITTKERKAAALPILRLLVGVIFALSGLVLLLTAFLIARKPTAEEVQALFLRRLLRKYGSRLVFTEAALPLPDDAVSVTSLESLLLLGEERRQPVLCRPDKAGLPADGLFTVQDGSQCFFYRTEAR